MGNNTVKIPEGFVLEQPAIPEGFVLEEIPKTIYAQPVPPEELELRGPQFRTTPRDIRPEKVDAITGDIKHLEMLEEDWITAVAGKVDRTIKQFWNKGIVDVAHGLGESDNPALIKAYEIQRSRMSSRRKKGKRLHSSLLDDEFKDITWQLGLKPEARDDDDLKNISDVYPVGEDTNPFPEFNIPPGQDAGDYIADTVAGIGSFVGQIYFLKKTLPGAPSQMIWEIQNVATGGKPGKGAAINTMLQAISHIPTTSVVGKGAKVVAGGGLFGGLTYAAGGDFTDIAVSTAIGAGFQGWDIHKQNQWLKSFKSHLKKAEYAKAQKAIAKGNKQAREVYQKDLARGMKQVDANFEYQRNLREATRIGERMLKGIEPKIDKAMDVISRRLHHGKLTGKEGELATKIVERGLSPKVVAEVAGVKLPKTSGQELAKKGYSKTERLFKLKPAKGSPAARIEAGQTIQVVRNAEGSIRAYYPTEFKLDLPTGWTVGIESLPEAALKIRLQEVATQKAKEQETLLSEARAEAEIAEMDREVREIQRPAEKAPEAAPKPPKELPPPAIKEAPATPEAEVTPTVAPTGEVIEKIAPEKPPTAPKAFKMSPTLQRLHDSPARSKGLDAVSESQAKSYFKQIRALAKKYGREDIVTLADEGEAKYFGGDYAMAVQATEGALGYLHQVETMEAKADAKEFERIQKLTEELAEEERKAAPTPAKPKAAYRAGDLEAKVSTPPDLEGIYFADHKEMAKAYTELEGATAKEVKQYKIELKNPATEEIENQVARELGVPSGAADVEGLVTPYGLPLYDEQSAVKVAQELKKRGYDGVIRSNGEIVVFDKSSITPTPAKPFKALVYRGISEKTPIAEGLAEGTHYTTDKKLAKSFAEDYGKKGELIEKEITLENPLYLTDESEFGAGELTGITHEEKGKDETFPSFMTRKLLSRGYDGIVYNKGEEIVVFGKKPAPTPAKPPTEPAVEKPIPSPAEKVKKAVLTEPELTKKELRQREIEAETEEAGISPQRRNRIMREIATEIKESDIYQAELEGLETKIGPGYYFVPETFRGEVEDIIGKRKGGLTKIQKMFTFDPHAKIIVDTPEGKREIGPLPWETAVQQALGRGKEGVEETWGEMDISDFVQQVKDSAEAAEDKYGLSQTALDKISQRREEDPYELYRIAKFEMLREGRAVTEIDEMTKEWAEHYGLDEAEIENEFLGAEPLKLKEIKKLPEAEQETAIEALARENVLKQERQEAKQAVNEVLKANDIEVEVEEVAEIKEAEEIPFERRGKPTGAAIITPAGREIVQLAYGADSTTGYHEGYHILRSHLTPKDRKVLDMRFKGDQEAEAREFAEFAKTGKATGYLRGIWRKLVEKLRKIKSALQGRGYRTANDIFGEIQRGVVPKEGAAPGAVQYERGVFGQPIQEQLRLPLPERQAAIKKVAVQEARDKIAKRKAKPTKEALPEGVKDKGQWKLTLDEYVAKYGKKGQDIGVQRAFFGLNHRKWIQWALKQGKTVPHNILEEYKSEKWAQEALNKPEAKPAIPKELQPLIEEARKYKTAEEFLLNYHNAFGTAFMPKGSTFRAGRRSPKYKKGQEAWAQFRDNAGFQSGVREGKFVTDNLDAIKEFWKQAQAKPAKPYEEWRPKGVVPIKTKLIKAVDAEIARTMKPRSNTVQITPEEIAARLRPPTGLFVEKQKGPRKADLFHNPDNPLPEVQEAFNQLVKGGPLIQFETSGDRMIRESMRNARIKAEKARIKASITPKARRGKLPIKIHDYTPVLSEALGKEPGALKKPRAETTKIKTQLEATAFLRDDLEPAKQVPAKPVELEKRVSTPKLTKRWFDENVGKEPLQIMAKISRETKEIADDVARAVWSSSLRLENIHPELMRRTREYCYRWMKRTAYMLEDAEPFLKKFKKLRHTNFKDWKALDLALKNSQGWMAEGIAAKHGMSEEYNTVRGLYDEIADMWDQVGGDLNRRADYWHREIKDSKGFLKHFYDSEHWSAIEQALKNRARRAGRDVADLTDEEKAQVINTLLRGYRTQAVTLATPGAVKERLVPVVDKEIDKYYYDSDVALVRYIREMNQAISQKEFFGRETRLVNKLRAQQSRRLSRLIKLKNRQGLKPGTTEVQYKEKIAKATEEWKAGQERLERLRTRDLAETIGGYVGKLKDQGMLSAEQERTVQRIIRGILQPKGMGRKTGLITTGIYIDTLNSFFQALTQLDEYAYAIIMSPRHAIPAGIRTIARKNRVKMRDIAVTAPGVEFEDKSLRKSLSQLLLVTTFRGIDVFGKESLINTALSKYEADARRKTLKPKFVADMKRVFGPEYKTVIEDLKRGEITENVNYLLFNVAADRQPIAYSEMPEMYNTGGNARILYTLKTFYLARLSYVRREAFNDMKHAKTFHQGFGKLLWIVGAFAALGAGSDALKDFLKGKTFDFADSVWNNVLNFIMWSKYSQYKAETEGIGRTVGEKLVPPTKAIDAATKDVVTIARDKDRGFEIWRSVPIVGEPYYWWFGRGREKIEAKKGKGWSEATE